MASENPTETSAVDEKLSRAGKISYIQIAATDVEHSGDFYAQRVWLERQPGVESPHSAALKIRAVISSAPS